MSDIRFAVLGRKSRKVHVYQSRPSGMSDVHDFGFGYIGGTLCGRSIYQVFRGGFIEEFDDARLCASCHHNFTDDKGRLFEHSLGVTEDVR